MIPAYSWFLALRYLLARWVNVLGMAGVAVAVWAMIVVVAVFSGFIAEIRDHIRGASADLVLTAIDPKCGYEDVRAALEADEDVVATAPRLKHYGIFYPNGRGPQRVKFTRGTGIKDLQLNYVALVGVDPAREARASDFSRWLEIVNDAPMPADDKLAELEANLRRRFEVPAPGSPFEVSEKRSKRARFQSGLGQAAGSLFETDPGLLLSFRRMIRGGERIDVPTLLDLVTAQFVRQDGADHVRHIRRRVVLNGAYETRYRTFDEQHAFVHIDFLREMLGQDPYDPESVDLVTDVAIRARPGADLEAVRDRLEAVARPLAGKDCAVLTWEQQNKVFLNAVDHERGMMKVVLFAVMMVAAFLIYATLHMMVMQKVKDIGILTSLGATPRGIAAIFTLCGSVVGALGCVAGAILGIISAIKLNAVSDWFDENFGLPLFPKDLYDLPEVPYRIEASWVAQVMIAALVLSLVVAYFPARRAARMHPVKTLSYE